MTLKAEEQPPIGSVNEKVLKTFTQNFRDAEGETWQTETYGYRVKFLSKSVKHTVDYSRNGHWIATIKNYDENNIPEDIRKTVNTVYSSYTIMHATEVQTRKGKGRVVKIEDERSCKTLKVIDGQMEIIEEFKKDGIIKFSKSL